MDQIALNRDLYNEFEKETINEKKIIELLNKGAEHLGNMSKNTYSEEPYEEIIYERVFR